MRPGWRKGVLSLVQSCLVLFLWVTEGKHPTSVPYSHQDVSSSSALKAVDSGDRECILSGVCPSKSDWHRHGSLVLHSHALF